VRDKKIAAAASGFGGFPGVKYPGRREPAQRANDTAVTVRGAGTEKIGEVEARVLELSVEGSDVRWLADPASGRILRTTSRTMGPAGPAEQAMDYSDWRMVDGVAFA
jgi:hypothetical protein